MSDYPQPEGTKVPPELLPPPVRLPPPVMSQPPAQEPPGLDTFEGALRSVFVGKNGIRAGWSLLIFLGVMFLTIIPIGIAIIVFHVPISGKVHSPAEAIIGEVLSLILVLVPTIVMSFIERKRFWNYGFLDRRALRRFGGGFCCGFVAISILIAILAAGGWIAFDGLTLHGIDALKYAGLWGIAFLILAVFEESMFRGYPQYTLARGMNFWAAAVILSVLFGLSHLSNPGENWLGILQVMVVGLVFSLSLRLTGSLLWAVGLHAGWDWAQTYFYGTPDSGLVMEGHLLSTHPVGNPLWSGGAAGPEGSVLAFFILFAVGFGVWFYWRPKQPAIQ